MRARHVLVCIAVLSGSSGCFLWSSGEKAPAPVQVTLRAGERLNPDEQGNPLPTQVHVYQLKAPARMEAAEFDDLYRRPKETLGEDLLQADDLVLGPGQQQTRTVARDKGARYLAVVAVFRRPAGPTWRSIVQLPPDGDARFTFVLEDYDIERR